MAAFARRHLNHAQLTAIAVEMLPALKEEAKKRQEATQFKSGELISAGPAGTGGTGEAGRNQHSPSLPPGPAEASGEAAEIVGVGARVPDACQAAAVPASERRCSAHLSSASRCSSS